MHLNSIQHIITASYSQHYCQECVGFFPAPCLSCVVESSSTRPSRVGGTRDLTIQSRAHRPVKVLPTYQLNSTNSPRTDGSREP